MPRTLKKPDWLKIRLSSNPGVGQVERAIQTRGLHTVCQEALCPNRMECFGHQTATFLLMGDRCTRNCTFCNVTSGRPTPLDPEEPAKIAQTAGEMGLDFVVLTSVTRDDLPDGGAAHLAATVRTLKAAHPGMGVEVLAPDFKGDAQALAVLLDSGCEVFNHNVETVPRLYPELRPQANFARSTDLLAEAKRIRPGVVTKTGLMLGLGETEAELKTALAELRRAEVDLLTLGQYLQPSPQHHPVVEYVHPDVFARLADLAQEMGFAGCASGPLVRSSYRAKELYQSVGR